MRHDRTENFDYVRKLTRASRPLKDTLRLIRPELVATIFPSASLPLDRILFQLMSSSFKESLLSNASAIALAPRQLQIQTLFSILSGLTYPKVTLELEMIDKVTITA